MSRKNIFIDDGFKNELSYLFSFNKEADHIEKMLNELIGDGIHFRIMDDDLSSLKNLRIIACDDDIFLMLKTLIELDKECSLIDSGKWL